jgi:hypothetical protein
MESILDVNTEDLKLKYALEIEGKLVSKFKINNFTTDIVDKTRERYFKYVNTVKSEY